jgi:hypothetical protein
MGLSGEQTNRSSRVIRCCLEASKNGKGRLLFMDEELWSITGQEP